MRNACGEVMQFLYGEDGMEGTAIEGQRMEFLRFNRRKFNDVRGPGPGCMLRGACTLNIAPPAAAPGAPAALPGTGVGARVAGASLCQQALWRCTYRPCPLAAPCNIPFVLFAARPQAPPPNPTLPPPPGPLQMYHFDLDRPGWAPDWLSPEVLDMLRTNNEARALLDAEVQVGPWAGWGTRGLGAGTGSRAAERLGRQAA